MIQRYKWGLSHTGRHHGSLALSSCFAHEFESKSILLTEGLRLAELTGNANVMD